MPFVSWQQNDKIQHYHHSLKFLYIFYFAIGKLYTKNLYPHQHPV